MKANLPYQVVRFLDKDKFDRIGGYLIVWGDPQHRDMDGEYFTAQTELDLLQKGERPIMVKQPDDARTMLGGHSNVGRITKMLPDGTGLWAEGRLIKALIKGAPRDLLNSMITAGFLSWASMSSDTEIDEEGQIIRWAVRAAILTPTPTQPPISN